MRETRLAKIEFDREEKFDGGVVGPEEEGERRERSCERKIDQRRNGSEEKRQSRGKRGGGERKLDEQRG